MTNLEVDKNHKGILEEANDFMRLMPQAGIAPEQQLKLSLQGSEMRLKRKNNPDDKSLDSHNPLSNPNRSTDRLFALARRRLVDIFKSGTRQE